MRQLFATMVLWTMVSAAVAQDRDQLVRTDRERFGSTDDWIYNDLERALAEAEASSAPVLVVFRCIPCEACKQFDEDVARLDPVVRELMDRFVRVRIVQMNKVDLERFRFDFDQSFAIVFLDPGGRVLGRYGTRSSRPESDDMALEGLRAAMEGALELYKRSGTELGLLEGKQVVSDDGVKSPEALPSVAGRYPAKLDYIGETAKSCLHCHQLAEGFRSLSRRTGPVPDSVMYPYPDPEVIGIRFDPRGRARVAAVQPGSIAAGADLREGDELNSLNGQPLISVADVQWVLRNAAEGESVLLAEIARGAEVLTLPLELPKGWRRKSDLSWRASAWDLRRASLGGMKLEQLLRAERPALGLSGDGMALRVVHVGEYGDHARAKQAGVQAGDVIIEVDGIRSDRTETDLLDHGFRDKRPGDVLAVTLIRAGERREARISLP